MTARIAIVALIDLALLGCVEEDEPDAPDPCDWIECVTPPPSYCDGNQLIDLQARGVCVIADSGPACEYPIALSFACGHESRCVNGQCSR